ncbi:MAG: hypothetical protein ACRD44_09335, partial [Bryobacteraceae bacterium]
AYWVQTASGTLDLRTATRLRVTTRGAATVRGDQEAGDVRFVLKKRVQASNAAEARRLLAAFRVIPEWRGAWGHVSVVMPQRVRAAPELEVVAPRALMQVFLETQGGSLRVNGLDGEVQAQTAGGRIEADQIGGAFIARTGGGEVTLGEMRGPVRCITGGGSIRATRAGAAAHFVTAGGEIHVQDVAGELQAFTGGGNIHVDRAGASVNARTSGGFILVREAVGVVEAETDGGPIRIGAASGVRCESASGMIVLKGVSGKLRALTTKGSIQAVLPPGVRLEDSSLTTEAGDITVLIPSKLAVTVRAISDSSGRVVGIVSDFPEIRASRRNSEGHYRQIAEGALNGGGPVLVVAASHGTIYVLRAK